MKNAKFNVTGMSCAACQGHVEKAVAKAEGVDSVSVNLLANKMSVDYDESITEPQKIIAAVEGAGYGASEISENAQRQSTTTRQDEIEVMKKRLWWSVGFLVPLFYICMGHMAGIPIPPVFTGHKNMMIYALTQLLLTVPIIAINFHYFTNGFKNLFHRTPNMDSLIALGAAASFVYSIFGTYMMAYHMGRGDFSSAHEYMMNLYYESCGMILTLITVGKYLEARSKGKTADAVKKLISLAPKNAVVIRDGKEEEIPADSVMTGDIFLLKAGWSVPCDGVIIEGRCTIDQSALTGESIPVDKSEGDRVMSASVNAGGFAKCRCEKPAKDSTLSQIIALVEEASATKAPVARLADKISAVFVPAVIIIALLSLTIWLALGYGFAFALNMAISVLVISCPCSLGLATPTAIMVGTGKAAQFGVLIKSAESLETAHSVDTVVLDKTGTCTEGRPRLISVQTANGYDKDELMKLCYSAESGSSHPLAKAITDHCAEKGYALIQADDYSETAGGGISALTDCKRVFIGNSRLMQENRIDISEVAALAESGAEQGEIPLYAAVDGKLAGILFIADKIKDSSKQAVEDFHRMGIETIMLTGDNDKTAKAIQKKLGIDKVRSQLMPEDKAKIISELQSEGKKTAMIGDGINDAPALTSADVGIAIGAGQDIALESADIVLMKSDLNDAVTAVKLSRKVMKNIKENLFWALIYNALGIPLAAGVFYSLLGWKLNPMFAAAAMSLSSVCVVTNALRLNFFKDDRNTYSDKTINTTIETEDVKMKKVMKIDGMMCNHCTGTVSKVLNAIDGVKAEISLEEKCAYLDIDGNVSDDTLIKAVTNAGYEVKGIE